MAHRVGEGPEFPTAQNVGYTRLPHRRHETGGEDGRDVLQFYTPTEPQAKGLFEWWMNTAYDDFVQTVPKMLEYGGSSTGPATDLLLIGRNLAELLDMHDAPDSILMELGTWFYMQGKVARLVADYKQKRAGKSDTWFDSTIYSLMARRIQEVGQWP